MKTIKTLALTCAIAVGLVSCSDNDNNDSIIQNETKVLFTSNNADGNVNVYNVTNINSVMKSTLETSATAADGIYYDGSEDLIVQASRSTLGLEGYAGVSIMSSAINATVTASIMSGLNMSSPREVAVNGDFYVVADNADADGIDITKDGRLFIYTKSGSNFTLRNIITTDIKLWGITFIGNDLYAVADTTNELAVYSNFLNNTSTTTLTASKQIAIEGIVRTHGLTYDSMTDTMILTDIGDADSGTDGGFHVIENFNSKFNNTANGATLAVNQQTRVAGSNTVLGNPVDVAYDGSTKTVFIAEAKNGKILAFNNINTGGNITPVYSADLAAASAVYFYKE
ncbi:hypothetical protein LPB03_01350 [Polaribacter vadi]|uniref:SMP-30/Gluconolactonase/LRE-like region domain-containing protein n=1 Tax=Polaribacter vadi TaxID=1774273 RepID=A0A1B8U142_9FLAO|nr:hypothetical protein [Polaribacter vadi]AOW16185.1 hypothetical protein LPB03_01350 [Polaribacter vadi]OBY65489.1 hypothetical protein LPB3_03760 [Polaribacter vadi]